MPGQRRCNRRQPLGLAAYELATAAAHELGTPLSTILVVARELEREIEPGSPHAEDRPRGRARAGS